MKILLVVHNFPPSGLGGSESYTSQLSEALSASHDVRLFYTVPDEGTPRTVQTGHNNGIAFWALKKNFYIFDRPFHERSRWVEREFVRAVDAFKPDIVHFQHLINLSLTLPSVAKKLGIPSCFTLHDFWLLCPRNFFLNQKMRLCPGYEAQRCSDCLSDRTGYYNLPSRGALPIRLFKQTAKQGINYAKKKLLYFSLFSWRPSLINKIFRNIDLFIAPSNFLLEKFVRTGIPPEKIVFCRHGFDTQIFRDIKKTSSPALRFAFIGGIRPHKGIDTLIAAFNLIPAPHELKIYGGVNPLVRQDLQRKIKNPLIHIMGALKQKDKKKAFSDIDVLILPSLCYENCPVVINEAFMTKTPVIVSDLGGMAELVEDGVSGLTFTAGDSTALAEKITMFINDKSLKERLATQIPVVKDIAVHADEIVQLYGALIGSRNSQPHDYRHRFFQTSKKSGSSQ
jgi:glycosyltransferase involved in cell wall biosynthesis